MTYTLDLTAVTPSTLPAHADVIEAAKKVIADMHTWKTGKKAHGVQSYTTKAASGTGPAWHARISKHSADELTFDQLWAALTENHYTSEKEYIHALKSVDKLQNTELGEVWALHYVFPSPVSPRVFVQLLTKHLEAPPPSDPESEESPSKALRTGYVVQLPFVFPADPPADPEIIEKIGKGIRGTYVSVERYQELEDGTLEWRMATCSTPGGSIPMWVSERSIPGEIIKDVPAVIDWIKKQETASS